MKDFGLKKGTVKLVEYNPRWKHLFEKERKLLFQAFPHIIKKISHGGSTALSGIPAKPIIDIFAVVKSLADADILKNDLKDLGYEYLGKEGVPERRLAVKVRNGKRTHHLQFVQEQSKEWKNHILLKEYYLTHPDVLAEYVALKKKLAQQFPNDRKSYTNGKDAFIKSVLKKAEKEIEKF